VKPWKTANTSNKSLRALDLHQFSSAMTRSAIRSYLEAISDGSIEVEDDLVVIVGKGLHSTRQPVLGTTVTTLLHDEFGLKPSIDPTNQGRLIIPKEDLEMLSERRKWI
jgi:hypothetical protein